MGSPCGARQPLAGKFSRGKPESAAEWAKSGVRVNALAPGYVATDMTLKMRERPELFNVWLEITPMGRLGETSEVAAAVLYLASPASGYVAGAILSIDGGYTAW
jgi:galactitol 2-dehydrogenase (L-tagatose-forming)